MTLMATKFIKLVLDSTYYINQDDINYIVWNDADDTDIVINVNRGEKISVGKFVLLQVEDESRTVESSNLEIIRETVMNYITAPIDNGIVYINHHNLSYINKTDTVCTVKFKNTAGLVTPNLNVRGKIKM